MLTFQKIIDFARSQKEEIVETIEDILKWRETDDIAVDVTVVINEKTNRTFLEPLSLQVDFGPDFGPDKSDWFPSINLFYIYVDNDLNKYNHEDLLELVENELNKFENSISAFDN